MGIARKNCIWADQCGQDCLGGCVDFSPVDCSEDDETFYRKVLEENAVEYRKLCMEFSEEQGEVFCRNALENKTEEHRKLCGEVSEEEDELFES